MILDKRFISSRFPFGDGKKVCFQSNLSFSNIHSKLISNLHSEIPIMLKNVLECGSENVFVFLRDVLSKPAQFPQTQCIVDGSTRQT